MTEAPRAAVCPACGGLNARDAELCRRCGAKLPGPVVRLVGDLATLLGAGGAPVTALIGLVDTAVFAATSTGPNVARHLLGGGSPAHLVATGAMMSPATDGEPWRLISAGYVHIGILHFGMNMLALVRLGAVAEQVVGSPRYAVAYAVTGVAGFALSHAWTEGPMLTAGASASLFGVMGVLLGWAFVRRDPRWKQFLLNTVLGSLLFGFLPGMRINNAAHMGGLIAGALLGAAFGVERRPYRRMRVAKAAAWACAAAVMASLALAHLSPISRRFLAVERARSVAGDFEDDDR